MTAAWPAGAGMASIAERYGGPLEPGDPVRVGNYRLSRRLGAGGMGTVYLGFTSGRRPVAVKTIRAELADDAAFRRRFAAEVEVVRRVHGLYTAMVVDADPDGRPPWLVVAFIPGPNLAEAVADRGPLGLEDARVLAAGVAEALQAIHTAGTVHRDLKPSNVLLSADGPRVIDFGIARAADATHLTTTGVLIGSPQFMAPEQATGVEAGPAADVFALGALLAYATTGRSPFGDGPGHAVLYRVVHDHPRLDGVPDDLRGLVERCLDKDPDHRPTPTAVIAELDTDAGTTPAVAGIPAPPRVEPAPASAIPPPEPPVPASPTPPQPVPPSAGVRGDNWLRLAALLCLAGFATCLVSWFTRNTNGPLWHSSSHVLVLAGNELWMTLPPLPMRAYESTYFVRNRFFSAPGVWTLVFMFLIGLPPLLSTVAALRVLRDPGRAASAAFLAGGLGTWVMTAYLMGEDLRSLVAGPPLLLQQSGYLVAAAGSALAFARILRAPAGGTRWRLGAVVGLAATAPAAVWLPTHAGRDALVALAAAPVLLLVTGRCPPRVAAAVLTAWLACTATAIAGTLALWPQGALSNTGRFDITVTGAAFLAVLACRRQLARQQ